MNNRIPIKKLNDETGNYYPLSVGESTVTTHDITVNHDIGNYVTGDVIPAVTTFDTIITQILEGTGGGGTGNVNIDDKTIVKNSDGQIQVNIDNNTLQYKNGKVSANLEKYVKSDVDENISGNYTFENTIKIQQSDIDRPKTLVEDPDPDGSFVIPSGLQELPQSGVVTNGSYIVSSNRTSGITVVGTNVSIYVSDGVTISNSNGDGIWVKPGAVCHLYNKGRIESLTENTYCAIFNEGTLYVKGGTYYVGKNNNSYYCILNHGELLEIWDVTIDKNVTVSSSVVNGYYVYETTSNSRSGFNADGTDCKYPKLVIHSGNYDTDTNTGIIKNDSGGYLTIYDGYFSGIGGQDLQNSGMITYIHGGIWCKRSGTRLIYNGFDLDNSHSGRNAELVITGGTFTSSGVWLWNDLTSDYKVISIKGGVFGPYTNYTRNSEDDRYSITDLIATDYTAVQYGSNVYVQPLSYLQTLKGIKFSDTTGISNTTQGVIINGILDVNDPTSAVSKAYVDAKETPIDNDTIVKNSSGNIEVNEYYRPDLMTTFEVIACSTNKTVHELLPDYIRYNKEPIYDLEGNEIYPSTRTIKGNGMTHNLVLRVSLTDDSQESIKNSDVIIDWGDGSEDSVVSVYNTHYGQSDYDDWVNRSFNTGLLDSESELNIRFEHTYQTEGKYIVKVIGKKFFGIMNSCTISNGNVQHYNYKSLVSRVFDDDLCLANNHVNLTEFCSCSPLLTEVYFSTRIEFPQVQNATSLFYQCSNLISVMGTRDKFRSVYSNSGAFKDSKNLLLTDYRIDTGHGYIGSFEGIFTRCSKLGKKFFDIYNGIIINPKQILGQTTTDPSSKVTINGKVITSFKNGDITYMLNGSKANKRGSVYQYQTDKWITIGNVCWNYVEDVFTWNGLTVVPRSSFNGVFYDCSSITANDYGLLGRMLWNNPITRWINTKSGFMGCSSMDLDKIPKSWGGNATDISTTIDISSDDGILQAVKLLLTRNGFDEVNIITGLEED